MPLTLLYAGNDASKSLAFRTLPNARSAAPIATALISLARARGERNSKSYKSGGASRANARSAPGPAALRNRTYPLRMVLAALTDYDTGFTLEETAARLRKRPAALFRHRPSHHGWSSTSAIAAIAGSALRVWPAFPPTRRSALSSSTIAKSIATLTTARSSIFCAPGRSTTNARVTSASRRLPIFSNTCRPIVRTNSSVGKGKPKPAPLRPHQPSPTPPMPSSISGRMQRPKLPRSSFLRSEITSCGTKRFSASCSQTIP